MTERFQIWLSKIKIGPFFQSSRNFYLTFGFDDGIKLKILGYCLFGYVLLLFTLKDYEFSNFLLDIWF
jgi:hypothetical protein